MEKEQVKPYKELVKDNELLRQQLEEARDTIDAIRNGEIDALVVHGKNGHELYTLKSADHAYKVFIEKMTEGAVTLNTAGVIIYSNSSFASIVGVPLTKVVASLFNDFVHDADKLKFRSLIDSGMQQDIKGEILLKNNNDTTPVQLSITALVLEEGLSLSVIVTDLTEQKAILEKLRTQNEQLEIMNVALELSNHDLQQFASVASHDLQEPLRKIQIFSHLLKEKFNFELSDTSRQYVEKIVLSANRMKALILDILNYSRLSAKERVYEKTNIKTIINELLDDLELTIKDKNATVNVQDMPELEVNRGQMRQVFQNLISNALKFSKKDTPPVIEIFYKDELTEFGSEKLSPHYCHIHVKDNGIGFDTRYSKSIFNLFEKLNSKDEYEGTGIGLAITKKIIEKHQGQIHVLSTIGIGSEFIVSLPRRHQNNR